MYSQFSNKVRKVLFLSKKSAINLKSSYIGTEHILLGLIYEKEGLAHEILINNKITSEKVLKEIRSQIGSGNRQGYAGDGFSPRTEKIFRKIIKDTQRLGLNVIDTEHILLGIIQEKAGAAFRIISKLGADIKDMEEEIKEKSGKNSDKIQVKTKTYNTPSLDKFGTDLTEFAQKEKLDPVIGREKEISRIMQILNKRTKNNPILIGESGVGKTAIVEGLAVKIGEGNVPKLLLNKRLVSLDLGEVIAGTKYRGEFEIKMKNIINDVIKNDNIILFIDELQNIIGTGAAEGSIDAANILKPALNVGELQLIGTTTFDEYHKFIERDKALARRFQSVFIKENSSSETIDILKGLRYAFESHHKLKITDAAIEAAVNLSQRYIHNKFLPDKAIDLIDEAGSKVRMKSLKASTAVKILIKKLNKIQQEKWKAVKKEEYERAARLKAQEDKIENKIEYLTFPYSDESRGGIASIKKEDIAEIVYSWTKIPLSKLQKSEVQKLLNLEAELHQRVVGQNEAVKAVANAVRRSRAGLKDPEKPSSSFAFLGPSGVGKTELARALAEVVFGGEEDFIKLDMSEYMERYSVSRLIGAPPGYVGYGEGGQLTEPVRRKPYSVVLFDEMEKAHPEVFNILLQILEDGVLTDGHGRKVDFKNTIIILTSNVGNNIIKMQGELGFNLYKKREKENFEGMKEKVIQHFHQEFRPEFINRLDQVIVFHFLTQKHLQQIVNIMLDEVRERLAEKNIKIEVTSSAREKLVEIGYDPVLGARPLRKTIEKMVKNPLAEEILKKNIEDGDKIKIEVDKNQLTFKKIEEKCLNLF